MNHQGPQIPEDVNDSNLYRAYRLLLSVCETGVLSRACDRTGLSLPTASRLLARARTWFDDPLFVHSAGRMYPTVRMKALRPRLIEAMRATDALFNEENVFDPQSAEGVVRIVAIDNAFYTLLIPLIMELRKEAPGIRFRVYDRLPEMMSVLRHGDLDLAVYSTLGKACPPDFHEQTLFESGHVLLVRRGHPLSALAKKRPLRLEDVAKYEHVGVAITMSTDGPRLIIGQQAMNVHDRLCCEMPFIVAGASLVARTDLVMRTPRETAVLLAKGLPLDVLHSEEDVSLPWRPGLFWHECSTNSPLLTWVRARLAVKAREIYDAAEKVLPF